MNRILGKYDSFDKRGGAKAANDVAVVVEAPTVDMFDVAENWGG